MVYELERLYKQEHLVWTKVIEINAVYMDTLTTEVIDQLDSY